MYSVIIHKQKEKCVGFKMHEFCPKKLELGFQS